MENRVVLSIDIGTSSIKAAVVDTDGSIVSYGLVPLKSFYRSMDVVASWESALKQLLPTIESIGRVEAVCVTGNGPTLVPVGSDLKPAAPAISWIRTPAKPVEGISSLYLPRLMHALDQHPGLLDSVRYVVGCPEYVSGLLSGEYVTFLPNERFAPYIWDDEQLSICGVDPLKVPPFLAVGEQLGAVCSTAAAEYGLPKGIPVFAGLIDFHAALLGCGVVREGMTCDRAGTSEGINYIMRSDVHTAGLRTLPNIIADTWTLAGLLPASGEVFEWYRAEAGMEDRSYADITRSITLSPPQHDYLFFPVKETYAAFDGMFVGGEFSDGGVCSDVPTKRGRAVAEGIGFSVRMELERLMDAGCRISAIRHCGGQARSQHWNYLKAQIIRVPIEVPRIIDAELLGCAVVCFTSMGLYSSFSEASDDLVHIERVYTPIQRTAVQYESLFEEWKERRAHHAPSALFR